MATKTKSRKEGYISKIVPKAISQARQDIASWKGAIREATNVDTPKRIRLQRLYNDIMLDAHLVSQIENRKVQTLQTSFSIYNNSGKVDDAMTETLAKTNWLKVIISNILDSIYYGPTLIELLTTVPLSGAEASGAEASGAGSLSGAEVKVATIPRTNFVPDNGMLYLDETDTKGIPYREVKEFGTWLLEFGQPKEFGLLNKAVPHVLFKRFAQSCWSELCEIYGIPPRVLKTNTQDPQMLSRGEMMMRDMGAASWYIIDETESFEFAEGVGTNGDVYNNLIKLCKDEISLLIMGAVIGQDTKHGNESKEEVSMKMFGNVVNADRRMVESMINTNVMPALYRIGIIPEGMTLYFDAEEDLPALWNMTKEALPFMEVDPGWIKDKFGIEVTGAKQQAGANFPMPGED
jgi:phage gp29-like protein